MRKNSTLIVLAIIALTKISFGQASFIYHDQQINKFASALFESTGVDGCAVTDVYVQSGQTKQKTNGGQLFDSPFTYVQIQQIDLCTSQYLYYAEEVIWESDYVANNLTSANVDLSLPAFDWVSGTTSTAHVALNWNATTPMVTHDFSNAHINLKGLHYSAISTGNYRMADATGTVTVGGGPNLTPEPGVFNYIIRGNVKDIININFVRPRMAMPGAENTAVTINPNPTTEVLHINSATPSHYRIVNLLGSLVTEGNMESKWLDLNVSHFTPGIYFLRLQTEQGEVVKKFVKE